jgi:hypothetical protein
MSWSKCLVQYNLLYAPLFLHRTLMQVKPMQVIRYAFNSPRGDLEGPFNFLNFT